MSKKKPTVPDHQSTDILGQLKENPKNPRTISKDKFQKLKKSILDFPKMMELRPIIYDKDKVVLGGNMRLKALRELVIEGLKVKPEYFKAAADLTKKEIKQFIIADNLPFGVWDFDLLAGDYTIEELTDFGFDEKELDLDLWKSEKTEEELDDAPEPQKTAISKTGDIFLLGGKPRVMCGDSTKESDVSELCANSKADMVFTDPPYNVDYSSKNELLNLYDKGNCIQTPIKNDNMIDAKEYQRFIDKFFNAFKSHLSDYNSIYVCGNYESLIQFYKMDKLKCSNMIVWVKNVMVLGRMDYQNQHEFIFYGWLGKHKWYGDRKQTTVWNFNKPMKSDLHPTMKPVELIKKAIINSTQSGNNIVLDVFLGSGSTLVACEETNRTCFGMEMEPNYTDVSIRRYHKLYPDKPIECLTNKNFNFNKLYEDQNGEAKKL